MLMEEFAEDPLISMYHMVTRILMDGMLIDCSLLNDTFHPQCISLILGLCGG